MSHRCVFAQLAKFIRVKGLFLVVTGWSWWWQVMGAKTGDMSRRFIWNLFGFLQYSVLIVNVTCWIFEVRSGDRRLILLFWWFVLLILLLTAVFVVAPLGCSSLRGIVEAVFPHFILQFSGAWRLVHKLFTHTNNFFCPFWLKLSLHHAMSTIAQKLAFFVHKFL